MQSLIAHVVSNTTKYPNELHAKIAKGCQCQYVTYRSEEDLYWTHVCKFKTINLDGFATAVYKQGTTSSGILIICDTMGTELNGSRQVMCNLSANGHHMIKPMLFATPDQQSEFLQMLVGFYQRGEAPKSLPVEIEKSIMYLKSVGVKQISLLGICWGGCIVQHMISTDDSFTSAVAVDGCFYQPNFTALVPSLFVLSNEDAQKETYIKMKNVMWQNNIYPWDMFILDFPLQHGFLLKTFECIRQKYLKEHAGQIKEDCNDPEFVKVCEVIIQAHEVFIAKINNFFQQFNSLA